MKNFFSNFFSSLLALVFFCFCAIVLGIICIVIAVSSSLEKEQKELKAQSVLVLSTNQIFTERNVSNDFEDWFEDDNSIGIQDAKRIIEDAKNNPNISALLIKSKGTSNSFVTCNQLYNSLNSFRASGKKIYAYGSYNEKDYLLASTANVIYAEPVGVFEWNGMAAQLLFYKKLMDKLDIKAQIFYAGKFKSATEPFRKESISAENRLQINELLNSFQSQVYQRIASNRKISIEKLTQLANDLGIQNLSDAKKYGFIDGVAYSDEVETKIKQDIGVPLKQSLNLVSFSEYEQKMSTDDNKGASEIALIYAEGTIVGDNSDQEGTINTKDLITSIRNAQKDENVKGIVLRINSPGGDAKASEKIWRAVSLAEKSKPFVVSFGSVAASGGYYIAMGGGKIFADPFTITGSIGVFAIIPNINTFLSKHVGVTYDEVGTSPNAVFGILNPLTPTQAQFVQNHIDTIYKDFKQRVMDARKLSATQVEAIAQGRVWTAQQALQHRLIDSIGSLYDAIQYVKKQAEVSIVEYPRMKNTFERIMDKISKKSQTFFSFQANVLPQELAPLLEQIEELKTVSNQGQAQMKLPYYLRIE